MPKKTTIIVHSCTQTTGTHHHEHIEPDPVTSTHPLPSLHISIIFPHSSPTPPPASPARRKQVPPTSTVPPESPNPMNLDPIPQDHNPITHDFPIDERILDGDPHPPVMEESSMIVPSPAPVYPPPRPSTSTTLKVTSTPRPAPQTDQNICAPIELQQGEKVSCFQQRLAQEIQCEEHVSPEGTRAEIR